MQRPGFDSDDELPHGGTPGRVRIDKWLWAARFFKTRSLAHEAIELGRVRLGGDRIKPAREVHVGELVSIDMRDVRVEVVVRGLSLQRGPASVAQKLYEETAESAARRARAREGSSEPARAIRGRPTKREGRKLRRLQDEP